MMSSCANNIQNFLFKANPTKFSTPDVIKSYFTDKYEINFVKSSSLPFDNLIIKTLETEYGATILKYKPVPDNVNGYSLCLDYELETLVSHAKVSIPVKPLGFANFGNTCYLNSTLQCLMASGFLLALIKSYHSDPQKCSIFSKTNCSPRDSFCALCGINLLLREHMKQNSSYYSVLGGGSCTPHYFTKNVKAICSSLRPFMQEDAHEFLLGLLSRLEDSTLLTLYRDKLGGKPINKIPPKIAMTNAIRRIFGGQIKCYSCQHISSRDEHWFNLSLDIINSRTLQQCLSNYIRPETLSGANAYKCANCKQLRSAERRCRIKSSPLILVVQFNRFSRSQKLDVRVDFPVTFNLRNYMQTPNGSPVVYRLYATLNHEGISCRSGHYVAFTKRHERWFLHNDSNVTTVSEEYVLRQHPYLLFYQLESKIPLIQHQNEVVQPGKIEIVKQNVLENATDSPRIQISMPLVEKPVYGPSVFPPKSSQNFISNNTTNGFSLHVDTPCPSPPIISSPANGSILSQNNILKNKSDSPVNAQMVSNSCEQLKAILFKGTSPVTSGWNEDSDDVSNSNINDHNKSSVPLSCNSNDRKRTSPVTNGWHYNVDSSIKAKKPRKDSNSKSPSLPTTCSSRDSSVSNRDFVYKKKKKKKKKHRHSYHGEKEQNRAVNGNRDNNISRNFEFGNHKYNNKNQRSQHFNHYNSSAEQRKSWSNGNGDSVFRPQFSNKPQNFYRNTNKNRSSWYSYNGSNNHYR